MKFKAQKKFFEKFLKIFKQNFRNFSTLTKFINLDIKLVLNFNINRNSVKFSLTTPKICQFSLKDFHFLKIFDAEGAENGKF